MHSNRAYPEFLSISRPTKVRMSRRQDCFLCHSNTEECSVWLLATFFMPVCPVHISSSMDDLQDVETKKVHHYRISQVNFTSYLMAFTIGMTVNSVLSPST